MVTVVLDDDAAPEPEGERERESQARPTSHGESFLLSQRLVMERRSVVWGGKPRPGALRRQAARATRALMLDSAITQGGPEMRGIAAFSLFAVLALVPAPARAQDSKEATPEEKKQAEDLLKQANQHWKDTDPATCRDLAEKAYALDPHRVLTLNFLGSFYDVKLGDADKSLEFYDKAIHELAGATEQKLKRLKADIMARKGDVLYASKDDLEGALAAYKASSDTFPLSTTADKFSNLLHRIAGMQKDEAKKKEQNELALKSAEQALELVQYGTYATPEKRKAWVAKVKTQIATCCEVLGRPDDAKKALEAVDPQDYDDSCLYNQALLDAVRGDGKKAGNELRDSMKNTRPTAKSRNQLRKMIRTEPDFSKFVADPSWKDVVTDEPV
jgi:tetratricopeptide (TPR) repeat protein